jgi:hypothetical protein
LARSAQIVHRDRHERVLPLHIFQVDLPPAQSAPENSSRPVVGLGGRVVGWEPNVDHENDLDNDK